VKRGYQVIAEGLTGNSYTDSDPDQGKANKYKIKAVVPEMGESPWSDEININVYKNIYENERNGPETTLTSVDWCYYAEFATNYKQFMYINGGYSGAYAGYNAYLYKYYDWDLFDLDLSGVDELKIEVINGNTSGLWGMDLSITAHTSSCNGYNPGNPSISGNTFTWSSLGSYDHYYLMVSMPDDLINYGSYSYKLKITITEN
jgi:hypothetical protein